MNHTHDLANTTGDRSTVRVPIQLTRRPPQPQTGVCPHLHGAGQSQRPGVTYDPDNDVWCLTSYKAVRAALADTRLRALFPLEEYAEEVLGPAVRVDGPGRQERTKRFRHALRQATRGRDTDIVAMVDEVMTRVAAQAGGNTEDDIARPIAAGALLAILGLPRTIHEEFQWMLDQVGLAVENKASPHSAHAASNALLRLLRLLLISLTRPLPGTLAGELLQQDSPERRPVVRVLPEDLMTTLSFIVTGYMALARTLDMILQGVMARPPALAPLQEPKLKECPAQVVEELLRFPALSAPLLRVAEDSIAIAGIPIPAGGQVNLILDDANRDPAQFPDPDRLDFNRRPNPHLAFGAGRHYCPGAPLARRVLALTLPAVVQRLGHLPLTGAAPEERAPPPLSRQERRARARQEAKRRGRPNGPALPVFNTAQNLT